jgi:hypothetical protein
MPAPTDSPPPSAYPIRVAVARPERSNRLLNFPLFIGLLIRGLLLIPHFIVISLLGLLAMIIYFIATFAILFSGKFPLGMFSFVGGVSRWNVNIQAYMYGLIDRYPPFSIDQQDYPVIFEAAYPQTSNRILNFPVLGFYIKSLLVIPHMVVIFFLTLVLYGILIVAPFVILFSGQYPQGMHSFASGVVRWSARISAYVIALTDRYPPFSFQ